LSIYSLIFFYSETANLCYHRTLRKISQRPPRLQLKIPLIDRVAGRVNLKIQQLDVIIETKTKDNVFVKLKVSAIHGYQGNSL
jgi:hypothetical protein